MSRLREGRSQAGFTLVEVLITVAISLMVSIPLLAWMIVGFKTEAVVERTSARSQATNQLSAFFPRDISSSSLVNTSAPLNCGPDKPGERVIASILNGTLTKQISYVITPAAKGSKGELVRRVCAVGGTTVEDTSILVYDLPDTSAASATVTCSQVATRPGDACGRAEISASLGSGPRVTATGSRRAGADA